MILGFTGTRKGMTDYQKNRVWDFLITAAPTEVHHGDCIGADAEFDKMAKSLGIKRVAHPCTIQSQRAYCRADEIRRPERPLTRNREIVDASQYMLAAPGQIGEVLRSGTWATIRYARKSARTITVFYPRKHQT